MDLVISEAISTSEKLNGKKINYNTKQQNQTQQSCPCMIRS